MKYRKWTVEETEYLKERWGSVSPVTIAKKLKRTEKAVTHRAYRIGLGDVRTHLDGLTIPQLANAMNLSNSCVNNFITLYGLRAHNFKVSSKQTVNYVRYEDFWEWANLHRHLIDFRKIEEYAIEIDRGLQSRIIFRNDKYIASPLFERGYTT